MSEITRKAKAAGEGEPTPHFPVSTSRAGVASMTKPLTRTVASAY